MKFKATEAQNSAIIRDGSILVSAAAGSGKTAVLTERVIRKLTDEENPVPANRLLIVTFTNAAAAEMRGRIEKRLYEEALLHPENEWIARQKYLISSADICTIDSFCIKLVRENFSVLGVSPDFRVSDGSDTAAVAKSVLSGIISPYLENTDEDFLKLLNITNCEFDESHLLDTVSEIFTLSQSEPFPERYLEELAAPYKMPFGEGHPWYQAAVSQINTQIDSCLSDAVKMAEIAAYYDGKNADKCGAYAENTVEITESLKNTAAAGDYNALTEVLRAAKLPTLPRLDKSYSSATEFSNLKADINEKLKKLSETFYQTKEEINADIESIRPAAELLVSLVKRYSDELLEALLGENILTFAFCEQLARKLLCEYTADGIAPTAQARDIIAAYDEVCVDEYQDVNDLQDMLFNIISDSGKHLFTVGDVKQSIYGFRGSNPKNFVRRSKLCEENGNRITLSDNFRSRGGVCRAVNYFFSLLLAGQTGEIVYDDNESLTPAAKFPENGIPAADVLFVDNSDSDYRRLDSEAEAIADYIEQTVRAGTAVRSDENTLRPVKYGDIAILMGTVQNKAATVAAALERRKIPVLYNAETFTDTFEIKLILSLLKVIDNPKSDVELLSVMLSPLFGFTADDVAIIRTKNRSGVLYAAVLAAAEDDERAFKFTERLREFRRSFAVLPLDRAISELYQSTDILNIVSVMPSGDVRRANLLSLCKTAADYAAFHTGGIYGFLKYISSLPEKAFKGAASSEEDGVRIMSMHTSKGLQFPVCILANLSVEINNSDAVSRIIYSKKFGIAFKYFDEETGCDCELLNHSLASYDIRKNNVDERLRLLYVAATRAEDKLCLVCSVDNAERKLVKLSSALSDVPPYIGAEWLSKSTSMCDWVLACMLLSDSAEKLRGIYGISPPVIFETPDILLKTVKGTEKPDNDLLRQQNENGANVLADIPPQNSLNTERMKENFTFSYPYEALKNAQAKISVSTAANSAEAERFAFTASPAFMLEGGLSAAGRGTAMHHIMQYISFENGTETEKEIKRLRESRYITQAEAAAADTDAIRRFFESPVFARIRSSAEVHREMRFLTEMPVGKLGGFEGVPSDTQVLVQGAVDLCFAENDGVTVLDFKTDRVDSLEVLKERYKAQLDIYSAACEKILKKPVKERIIYSFTLSDSISF